MRGVMRYVVVALLAIGFTTLFYVPRALYAESVTAVVPTPPPSAAPTIIAPEPNATFTQKSIQVRGACGVGLIVKIFRNTTFAGSTTCLADGTYEVHIDLNEGRNSLLARQYDSINQPSPESTEVVVYFTPPLAPSLDPELQPNTAVQVAKFELKIDYDYTLQRAFSDQVFRLPIRFAGGTAPYAISIEWGDGETTLLSRPNADLFVAEHTFKKSGSHQVKIRISDSDGSTAFLQFVVIVNGSSNEFKVTTPFGEVRTGISVAAFATLAMFVAVPSLALGVFTGWYLWKKSLPKP